MRSSVRLPGGARRALVLLAVSTGACQPKVIHIAPGRALPADQACGLVNANLDRISGTLRATGTVDGRFIGADGKPRTFSLDGTLFFLAPHYVRFDLKKLGDTQIRVGSNALRFWSYSKEADDYECGWHDDDRKPGWSLPLMPVQLIEALGLTRIPTGLLAAGEVARVQRIESTRQQILFLAESAGRGIRIAKEVWLDRYGPHLVRRVVFRSKRGGVDMFSKLDDYASLDDGGPWLPHLLNAEWLDPPLKLRFRIRKWRSFPQVTADGIQFRTPRECEAG